MTSEPPLLKFVVEKIIHSKKDVVAPTPTSEIKILRSWEKESYISLKSKSCSSSDPVVLTVISVLLVLVHNNLSWSIENEMAMDRKSIGFES